MARPLLATVWPLTTVSGEVDVVTSDVPVVVPVEVLVPVVVLDEPPPLFAGALLTVNVTVVGRYSHHESIEPCKSLLVQLGS